MKDKHWPERNGMKEKIPKSNGAAGKGESIYLFPTHTQPNLPFVECK